MDEKLLTTNHRNTNTNNLIYIIVPLVVIAGAYTALMVFIYIDIHNMDNNLDKIIDIINLVVVNTTSVDSMRNDFTLIKECVLHKYCKRV
jgi:formate hydrogenlyase subunit 4